MLPDGTIVKTAQRARKSVAGCVGCCVVGDVGVGVVVVIAPIDLSASLPLSPACRCVLMTAATT